jgi:predicted nucleotidyltransferase
MIHPAVQKLKPIITAFLRQHKVKRAYLFGSATTSKFRADSDIDLLVSFEEGLSNSDYAHHFWSIYLELPKLIGHPIDLITEDELKNPFFIEEINETKIPIYDKEGEEIPV